MQATMMASPQFQNLSPQFQTAALTTPPVDPLARPARPEGPRFLDALRGQGGENGPRPMTPEWMAYQQAMDAFRARTRGSDKLEEHEGRMRRMGQLPGQVPPMQGQAQQIAPAMPQGFAPPGMVGSSYAVRGMNPGATPFDLPTY